MKYIFVLLFLATAIFGSVIKSKVLSIDEESQTLSIKVKKVNLGMSGFVSRQFTQNHSSILKNVVVVSFDDAKGEAVLKVTEYDDLAHSALPKGKWSVEVGDDVVLAYGYSRAMLISPSEEIYYRVTKSAPNVQWVHPDLFTTILSFSGHPTPLKEDFEEMAKAISVGLYFFYLDKRLYTLDARSFVILNISPAELMQESTQLPFYARIKDIDAAWWGEGSDELTAYEPYYYELMIRYNSSNKKLYEIIKNGGSKLEFLLDKFEIEE